MAESLFADAGRAGALARWAHTFDRRAATEPLRDGYRESFRRQAQASADAQGIALTPAALERSADAFYRAHLARMTLARRRKAAARRAKRAGAA